MGENFSFLSSPIKATKVIDDGPLSVSTIKTDHVQEKTSSHKVVFDQAVQTPAGSVLAGALTGDVSGNVTGNSTGTHTGLVNPPASSSTTGTIVCGAIFVPPTANVYGSQGFVVRRAGVYSFRVRNPPSAGPFADQAGKYVYLYVNGNATSLAACASNSAGTAQNVTLAVGDLVCTYPQDATTGLYVEIRNNDGAGPW